MKITIPEANEVKFKIKEDGGVDLLDTSDFILPAGAKQALVNMLHNCRVELTQMRPTDTTTVDGALEFQRAYTTKSYEVEFIAYLLQLSHVNISANNKPTEDN